MIASPTRVTSKTISLIDNILKLYFGTSLNVKKAIINSDVSVHFPEDKKITIHRRVMHDLVF